MRRRTAVVAPVLEPCACRTIQGAAYRWGVHGRERYERWHGPLCVHVAAQIADRAGYMFGRWKPGEEAYVRSVLKGGEY